MNGKQRKMESKIINRPSFQDRLIELLQKDGSNQTHVARETGIPQTTINAYLTSNSEPTVTRLVKLAEYFGVTTDYLTGISDDYDMYSLPERQLTTQQIEAVDTLVNLFIKQNREVVSAQMVSERRTNTENSESSVYFLHSPANNRVKIGYSTNPSNRIRSILTSSPTELKLLAVINGTRDDEQLLHQRFAHLRVHLEWFSAEPELLQHIEALKGGDAVPMGK